MQLRIGPERLVGEVQQEFSSAFQFLQLQFLKHGGIHNGMEKDYGAAVIIAPQQRLGSLHAGLPAGLIMVEGDTRIDELEEVFRTQFGLHVQVFRRSGNLWLRTSLTSGWTLAKQDQHGKEITGNHQPLPGSDHLMQ